MDAEGYFPKAMWLECEADHLLFHLVPRLRMYEALPPLYLYALMVWCLGTGATLLL